MNNSWFHILNGLGALLGVYIAYMSWRKANAKDDQKTIAKMQKLLRQQEKQIAVMANDIKHLQQKR